jgi:hypothetical protein
MSSFRDIKRKARRDLHREMQVPALYMLSRDDENPRLVHVRLHTKFVELGDQKGTNFLSAERLDIEPRIIFMRDEVNVPARNAIISVVTGEAYYVDRTEPADDITIKAYVVEMTVADAAGLPVPGEN